MDRASHRFGRCSECHEIICVEKAVTDGPSTHGKTSQILDEAFRIHIKLRHSEDFNLAAIPATERHDAQAMTIGKGKRPSTLKGDSWKFHAACRASHRGAEGRKSAPRQSRTPPGISC